MTEAEQAVILNVVASEGMNTIGMLFNRATSLAIEVTSLKKQNEALRQENETLKKKNETPVHPEA